MTSRIRRGFHRIGVVLAAASLLFAAVVAVVSDEPKVALFPVALAALLCATARAVGRVLAGSIGSDRP